MGLYQLEYLKLKTLSLETSNTEALDFANLFRLGVIEGNLGPVEIFMENIIDSEVEFIEWYGISRGHTLHINPDSDKRKGYIIYGHINLELYRTTMDFTSSIVVKQMCKSKKSSVLNKTILYLLSQPKDKTTVGTFSYLGTSVKNKIGSYDTTQKDSSYVKILKELNSEFKKSDDLLINFFDFKEFKHTLFNNHDLINEEFLIPLQNRWGEVFKNFTRDFRFIGELHIDLQLSRIFNKPVNISLKLDLFQNYFDKNSVLLNRYKYRLNEHSKTFENAFECPQLIQNKLTKTSTCFFKNNSTECGILPKQMFKSMENEDMLLIL